MRSSNRLYSPSQVAFSWDVTPRYCEADPYEGGKQAVAEAYRNLTAVGATPIAITDCLNFGNPERPEIMGQFVGCVEGMAEACRALDFPVVSGNVSLYNETKGAGIPPTPAVGGVGLIGDVSKRAVIGGAKDGDTLVLVGEWEGWLGQSQYMRVLQGRSDGAPPPVDLAEERRVGTWVRKAIERGVITGAHDISDGGLAIAAVEMALASDLGLRLSGSGDFALHAWLFGEDQGRYLLAASDEALEMLRKKANEHDIQMAEIGRFGGEQFIVSGAVDVTLAAVRKAHEDWLPSYMAAPTLQTGAA